MGWIQPPYSQGLYVHRRYLAPFWLADHGMFTTRQSRLFCNRAHYVEWIFHHWCVYSISVDCFKSAQVMWFSMNDWFGVELAPPWLVITGGSINSTIYIYKMQFLRKMSDHLWGKKLFIQAGKAPAVFMHFAAILWSVRETYQWLVLHQMLILKAIKGIKKTIILVLSFVNQLVYKLAMYTCKAVIFMSKENDHRHKYISGRYFY